MASNETLIREDVLPGETIQAKVLPETPNALQLGARCAELGYGFFWHPFQRKPSFFAPDGTPIECEVDENFIPIVRRSANGKGRGRRPLLALPAVEAEDDSDTSAFEDCDEIAYVPGEMVPPEGGEDGNRTPLAPDFGRDC